MPVSVNTIFKRMKRQFPSEADALARLEAVRWPDGPVCPYCGKQNAFQHQESSKTRKRWQCRACHRSFSATVDTVFHHSHVDLRVWFFVIAAVEQGGDLKIRQLADLVQLRPATVSQIVDRVRHAVAKDKRLLRSLIKEK